MKNKAYSVLPRENYNGDVKLRGVHIPCYTKKQLDDMYPDDDYVIVGETKAKNKKRIISDLYLGDVIDIKYLDVDKNGVEIPLEVANAGEHSKIFYKRAGYVPVGENTYIALLKFRFAFIFFLLFLIGGVAAALAILLPILFGGVHGDPNDTDGPGTDGPVVLNPLPPADTNAEKVEGDTDDKVQSEEGGGFVSMTYALEVVISLSTGDINMYFQNPNKSNHDVAITLYIVSGDTEVKIAESGLLKAGYRLSQLKMIEGSATLSEGNYEGKYLVGYYDPETGERALVESECVGLRVTVIK